MFRQRCELTHSYGKRDRPDTHVQYLAPTHSVTLCFKLRQSRLRKHGYTESFTHNHIHDKHHPLDNIVNNYSIVNDDSNLLQDIARKLSNPSCYYVRYCYLSFITAVLAEDISRTACRKAIHLKNSYLNRLDTHAGRAPIDEH